jgi:RecJ-like exonuclease
MTHRRKKLSMAGALLRFILGRSKRRHVVHGARCPVCHGSGYPAAIVRKVPGKKNVFTEFIPKGSLPCARCHGTGTARRG